uniref:Integrase catalytic domain-containing protein n=1 Tax=Knipowitschia caucasica TaxID=637954 RepID=A0AAV2MIZ9_KNICA
MSTKEKRKVLLKLHKQFGHASAERLQKLIQSSGNTDQDCPIILQETIRDCEICQRYSRSKPKPAVGLPLASQYNETVAMDLHELEPGVWYLHIIDHFTRFSAGNIVRTKKPSEIVNSFIHSWISVHGAPKRIYTDNGGEFNNAEIRDMAENFNIETKTTAGYSPWSNGLLERHNMTLTEILLKGMELSRDVYIQPPPEAEGDNVLWKLKKCVYGLADASLYWYNKVKELMLNTGGKMSQMTSFGQDLSSL